MDGPKEQLNVFCEEKESIVKDSKTSTKRQKSRVSTLDRVKKSKPFKKNITTSPEKKKLYQKKGIRYSCSQCNFVTQNIMKHIAHKRQHRESKSSATVFKCQDCNYSSKVKAGLQRHVKRNHMKERPFTCPVCNYSAVEKLAMTKHIIKLHQDDFGDDLALYIDNLHSNNGSPEKNADNALNSSSSSEQLNIDDNLDKCETDSSDDDPNNKHESKARISNRNAELSSSQNKLVKNEHLKLEKFEESTHSYKALYDSVKSSNTRPKRSKSYYATPEYREIRNRKLTCTYCKLICNSRRELHLHTNSHKDANVHCPICYKFVVDEVERFEHIKSHTENRNFLCTTCLCSFDTESQVLVHQHEEHKKSINLILTCMFCPFSSRSQERYTRHMTRYHMFRSMAPKHNPFDLKVIRSLLNEGEQVPNESCLDAPTLTEFCTDSSDLPISSLVCDAETVMETLAKIEKDFYLSADDVSVENSFLAFSNDFSESMEDLKGYLGNEDKLISELDHSENKSRTTMRYDRETRASNVNFSENQSLAERINSGSVGSFSTIASPCNGNSSGRYESNESCKSETQDSLNVNSPRYSPNLSVLPKGCVTKGMMKCIGGVDSQIASAQKDLNFKGQQSPDSTSGVK